MADKFLSAGHAVVFPELPGSSPLDYVQEIGSIIGSSHVHSFYKNDGLIKIYLKGSKYVEKVADSGIDILGHHLQANNIEFSLQRVTLFKVDPIIPDSFLEELLKTYGTLVSPITHNKLSKDACFAHIDSGVRYADLKVCNGVSIPSTIQVKYKDILCSVGVEVKKEVRSKIPGRSSKRFQNARNDSTITENDSTVSDGESSNQSSLSLVESISLSEKFVRKLPVRRVKKVIKSEELSSGKNDIIQISDGPSTSKCNVVKAISEVVTERDAVQADCRKTHGLRINLTKDDFLFHKENSFVEIGTSSVLVQNTHLISSHNALSICDLSVPKSTESRYTYRKEKQRLKSGKVLSELFTKNLIPTIQVNSRPGNEQCASDLGFPGSEQASISKCTISSLGEWSRKKSVISELISCHRTQNPLHKKVTSYTLNSICDIKLANKTNASQESNIERQTNNIAEIEKTLSNSNLFVKTSVPNPKKKSFPKQEHIKTSTSFQDTPKSSNKNNEMLTELSLLANCDFVESCSVDIFNTEQNLNQQKGLPSRLRTNTILSNLSIASTSTQNTDASTVLLHTSDSSKCLDFICDSFKNIPKDFNKRISLNNGHVKGLLLSTKKFETPLDQASSLNLSLDIKNDYLPTSLANKKKFQRCNLSDSRKDVSGGSHLAKLRSSSKKPKSSMDQISMPALSQNISWDVDCSSSSNKEESHCLNLNDSSSIDRTNSNKSKINIKQMLTPALPQDILCPDIPNLELVNEESVCSNTKKISRKERSAGSRPKSLAFMPKKPNSSIEMLMPSLLQDTTCDEIPSSVLSKKKSQGLELKGKSKDRSEESLLKKLQSNFQKASKGLISTSALPEDITCNDVPSLLLNKKKSQCPDMIATSNKNISLNNQTRHSRYKSKNTQINIEQKSTLSLQQDVAVNDDIPSAHLDKKKFQCPNQDVSFNSQLQPKSSQYRSKGAKTSREQKPSPDLSESEFGAHDNVSSSCIDEEKFQCSNLNADSIKDSSRYSVKKSFETLLMNQTKSSNSSSKDLAAPTSVSSPASIQNVFSDLISKDQNSSELNVGSKNSEKRPSETQYITQNKSLCPSNKEIQIDKTVDSTPVFAQNITSNCAISSLLSNEELAQISVLNASLNQDGSKDSSRSSDTQCLNNESSLSSRDKEDKMDINMNIPPVLVPIISNDVFSPSLNIRHKEKAQCSDINNSLNNHSSKDSGKLLSDKQCSNKETSLPSKDKEGKVDMNLDVPPVLDCIISSDAISSHSNDDLPQCLDINANSEEFAKKPHSTLSANLGKDIASSTKNIIFDSQPDYRSNLTRDIQCHGIETSLASNLETLKHSKEFIEMNPDKSVNFVSGIPITQLLETSQLGDKLNKADSNLNPIPVLAQNPKTSLDLPILFKDTTGVIQNFRTGECKSTDFDVGLSNSCGTDHTPTTILPLNIKPTVIGACLPIPQFIPDTMNCKVLNTSQELLCNQSINLPKNIMSSSKQDEKAKKSNSTTALVHHIELLSPQISSILVQHDKIYNTSKNYQYILPKSLHSTSSAMNVDQGRTNIQSSKKRKYSIGSIFHKTKSNSFNKNKKPARKRKTKAKVSKVNFSSNMNSVQNKTCFSEYEFNSSDSDSNGISYSKWRSQNKTPQKRFRSSSVDEVKSKSLSSLSANNEPYDLSFKSKKVSSTVVNNPRYDYNTLVRKKRERINAICQRVSLINKKNLSGGSFEICKNKEVVQNPTIHELSTLSNVVNDYPKEQQIVDLKTAAVKTHTNECIPNKQKTDIAENIVSDLECNISNFCSNSTSIIKNVEVNHEVGQVLESVACTSIKNNLNSKTVVKSLQKKGYKNSLSQMHAKKVKKRMKKNRVRYMCLQSDGKKIVLKKVSTASDNHRNVVDLVNQNSGNAAMPQETRLINNQINTDVNNLGTVKNLNSVLYPDTENLDFNTCVNGFLQQLAHCNQQTTDKAGYSPESTTKFIPIEPVTKTFCKVDNKLQLKDLHTGVGQSENVGLVLECQTLETTAKDRTHNLQPNEDIQCTASTTDESNSGNILHIASSIPHTTLTIIQSTTSSIDKSNLVVEKNVECPSIEMNKLNEKCLNTDSEFQENHIPERVVIKVEEPQLEDCIGSDFNCVKNTWITSHEQANFEQFGLDLPVASYETADSNCVSDLNQPSLAIRIEAVYGSEQALSICSSQPIGEVQTVAEKSDLGKSEKLKQRNNTESKLSGGIYNDVNESLVSRNESVGLTERTCQEISGDNSIPHNDAPGQEPNTVSLDQDSNKSIEVNSHSESVVKKLFIKCEVEEDGVVSSGGSSNEADGRNQAAFEFENNQPQVSTEKVRLNVDGKSKSSRVIYNCIGKDLQSEVDCSLPVCTGLSDQSPFNSSEANEIVSSSGRSVKVKKEQLLLNAATSTIDVPRLCDTKPSHHAKSKGVLSPKSIKNNEGHNSSQTFEPIPSKRLGNCSLDEMPSISYTGKESERLNLNDSRKGKQHSQSLDNNDDSEELSNTQGHYMIEKTEKPNTFRIFRQVSVSSEHIPNTAVTCPEADESMVHAVASNNNLKRNLVEEDEKWGPYLAKPKDRGSAKRFKRSVNKAQSCNITNEKFLSKKKLPYSCISDSKQNTCEGNISLGDCLVDASTKERVGVCSQFLKPEINGTLVSSTSVLETEADSSDVLISTSIDNCGNSQNGELCMNNAFTTACPSEARELDPQNSVSKSPHTTLSSDTVRPPCDKSVIDSDKVVPADIYSVYRTISKKETNSSVINFPLSEQCLVKFLHAAKGHPNPKKLALNVLQNNKTPGALKELIVQLYDYFKVCNDKKKKLRVSRLIMLLDNRNK